MGKEQQAEFYDEGTGEKSYYLSKAWYKKYKDNYSTIVSMLPEKFDKVLDLGCGVGFLGEAIIQTLGDVGYLGIDFSSGMIRRANKLFPGLDFVVADLRSPVLHAMYKPEYVYIFRETLEHIEVDLEVLSWIPSSAIVILSVPNYDDPGHVRYFKDEAEVKKRYSSVLDITESKTIILGKKNKDFIVRGVRK